MSFSVDVHMINSVRSAFFLNVISVEFCYALSQMHICRNHTLGISCDSILRPRILIMRLFTLQALRILPNDSLSFQSTKISSSRDSEAGAQAPLKIHISWLLSRPSSSLSTCPH